KINADSAKNGAITCTGAYYDILGSKETDSTGTVSSVNSYAALSTIDAWVRRGKWNYSLFGDFSDLRVFAADKSIDLNVSSRSLMGRAGMGVGYSKGRLIFNGTVWTVPLTIDGDEGDRSFIRKNGCRLSAAWSVPRLYSEVSFEFSPIHSSLTTVSSISSGARRGFPLYIMRAQTNLTVAYYGETFSVGLTPSYVELGSDTSMATPYKLNTDVYAQGGQLSAWTDVKCLLTPIRAQAAVKKYSFAAAGVDGMQEYFSLPDAGLSSGQGRLQCRLPGACSLGLFGEITDIKVPAGYFEAFPFSSWTIFDPIHYKITRISQVLHEGGLCIDKKFMLSNSSTVNAGLDGSFLYYKSVLGYKERKVQILIPYYSDESVELMESKFIIVKVNIGYMLKFGAYALSIAGRQIVPISMSNQGSVQSASAPQTGKAIHHQTYGGLIINAAVTMDY
ncbi:MAG TPA: hypothetical protein VF335_08380, partial [Chitinivibrionales bacterium]